MSDDREKVAGEPNLSKWCGALLAYARGNEVECNLPKGHAGNHKHVLEGQGGAK